MFVQRSRESGHRAADGHPLSTTSSCISRCCWRKFAAASGVVPDPDAGVCCSATAHSDFRHLGVSFASVEMKSKAWITRAGFTAEATLACPTSVSHDPPPPPRHGGTRAHGPSAVHTAFDASSMHDKNTSSASTRVLLHDFRGSSVVTLDTRHACRRAGIGLEILKNAPWASAALLYEKKQTSRLALHWIPDTTLLLSGGNLLPCKMRLSAAR